MNTFTDYFHNLQREYTYTVKLACDALTEEDIDRIEQRLKRLDLVSLSEFSGTPLQENPLDFPSMHNASVHIADFVVKYPSSSDMLERAISEALGMPRGHVVVYTENDPRKLYTEQHLERNDPSYKENYEPALGSEHPVMDGEKEAQEDYPNQAEKMMDVLDKKRGERKLGKYVNTLIPDQVVDAPANSGQDMGPMGDTSPFTRETRT